MISVIVFIVVIYFAVCYPAKFFPLLIPFGIFSLLLIALISIAGFILGLE